MSPRIVHRPARSSPSTPKVESWEIERPPQLPEDNGAGNLLMLVPMLGAGASMTVMMLFRGSGLAAVGALMMILTVVAFTVMMLSQRGKAARRRRQLRDRYLTYLDRQGQQLLDSEAGRVRVSRRADPHPGALLGLVRSPQRLWERRRDDEDFLRLRIGTGAADARTFVRIGDDPGLAGEDEFMSGELERVERRYAVVPDSPVTVDLDSVGQVSVVGPDDFCRRVAMVLTAHAAALTSPEDLQMALVAPPEVRASWDWMAWLPHLADQARTTDIGPERRIARDEAHLAELLRPELHRRLSTAAELRRNLRGADVSGTMARLWVVADTHGSDALRLPLGDREISPADLGVTILHLLADREQEPDDITVRISPDPQVPGAVVVERYLRRDQEPITFQAVLDDFSRTEAETLGRQLAGVRLSPDSLEHDTSQQVVRAADLLGVEDLEHIDVDRSWRPRPRSSFLRVQIGTDDQGEPVMLDLKESAHFGMGPHGLAIGATGSGKSELLRTLVLGLCAGHGPADVNLVLVDYKGGAAFAPFADLPHVAGVITNLGDDANLVERVYASLNGEIQRRQQVLKDAGNLASVTAYRRLRSQQLAQGEETVLEPLPHLVVIIDEFGELLTARPDFIDLFLSIGRIGRSIGVHLLLSSQRIEGGKLRGLETYLSYRIGLRTLSEAESRTVLETPDAFSLPPVPGYGYLKVDTTTYTRFRSGYVSGSLPSQDEDESAEAVPEVRPISDYASRQRDDEQDPAPGAEAGAGDGEGGQDEDEGDGPTILSTVLAQLARPRVTRPIWLPPVPDVITLDGTVGQPAPTRLGLRVPRTRPLSLPLGILDDPAKQWQGVYELDLGSAGGHVLVIGAPRTGKTTALLTVAASLALTHPVRECVVYAVDLLGSGLAALADLPNVSGVATRLDREVVRRTVEEVHAAMHAREGLLQQHRLPDLTTARERAATEDVPWAGEDLSDVLLLVDGIGQFSEEFAEHEDQLRDLIRRGAGFGVHVVATATRSNEVRVNLQSYFGNRLELRLNDPGESAVGRKLAETLTTERPGQFLTAGGLFGQLALPRIDGVAERASAAAGLSDLVAKVAAAAREKAPTVRLLPPVVRPEDLATDVEAHLTPIGLHERDLTTAVLDLDGGDRNILMLGDNATGRTSTLRYLAAQLIGRHTPDELVFAVFDPRRTLRGAIPEDYLGGYAPSSALAERLVAAILPELSKRVPSTVDGTTDAALPQPRIVLLVDDYDVLTAGGVTPLAPLQPFLAMSHEINVSVLLARRMAGASRGIYDPVMTTAREAGATGLMFSGDRSEGMLLGNVRPQTLPTGRALLLRAGQPGVTIQVVTDDSADEMAGVGFGGKA